MPTAEEAKVDTAVDEAIKRSQAVVEVLTGELSRMTSEAAVRARTASQALSSVKNDLRELQRADTLPMEFTGRIHDYRFGMFESSMPPRTAEEVFKNLKRKADKKKVKPSHRFEIEVPDTGLWLHVRCSSEDFEEFLMSSEGLSAEDGTLDPNVLNGMTVTVRRDKANNRLVPIGLGTVTQSPTPLGKDKSDNPIFKGDGVRVRGAYDSRIYKAIVLGFDGRAWTIQRNDRAKPTTLLVGEIERARLFEKVV